MTISGIWNLHKKNIIIGSIMLLVIIVIIIIISVKSKSPSTTDSSVTEDSTTTDQNTESTTITAPTIAPSVASSTIATTAAPTTAAPTTAAPTTAAPTTTVAPTTAAPTTAAPTKSAIQKENLYMYGSEKGHNGLYIKKTGTNDNGKPATAISIIGKTIYIKEDGSKILYLDEDFNKWNLCEAERGKFKGMCYGLRGKIGSANNTIVVKPVEGTFNAGNSDPNLKLSYTPPSDISASKTQEEHFYIYGSEKGHNGVYIKQIGTRNKPNKPHKDISLKDKKIYVRDDEKRILYTDENKNNPRWFLCNADKGKFTGNGSIKCWNHIGVLAQIGSISYERPGTEKTLDNNDPNLKLTYSQNEYNLKK